MRKAVLAVVVGLAAIVVIVVFGHVFSIREIRVRFENEAECATKADIVRMAGISPGTNIFVLDEKRAARRIESNFADNELKVVGIERVFPNEVVICVRERLPIFKIRAKTPNATGYVTPDMNFQRPRVYETDPETEGRRYILVEGCEVGDSYDSLECRTLKRMARHFVEKRNFSECALVGLIEAVEFAEDGTIRIRLRVSDTELKIAPDDANLEETLDRLYSDYLALDAGERDGKTLTSADGR